MTELLELIVIEGALAWALLAMTIGVILIIPKLFGINLWNGLIFAQLTLFFTSISIVSGLTTGSISLERGIHFYSVELTLLIVVYSTYARLLRYRAEVVTALQRFFSGPAAGALVAFIALIAIFNYLMVPDDGGSRIEYMTNSWYSFAKPLIVLAMPVAYLGIFVLLLDKKNRYLGYMMLTVTVASSIMSGSKASFTFSLLSSFLAMRDLHLLPTIKIRTRDKLASLAFLGVMVPFSLSRLDVKLDDVMNRFLLFGEANLMTYFSYAPTAACENISTFAKMHRGFARLFGDASAQNIDTLFGYSLMITETGANTYTGPNARISAYTLCNFPNESIILAAIVVLIYIGLTLASAKRARTSSTSLALFYPYAVASLSVAAIDFNLIMQDITLYGLFILFMTFFNVSPRYHRG